MITVSDLGLAYSGQPLFSHVDLQFTKGNCYGIIGANGAGKSTFLKILSGELEPTSGEVSILPKTRMSVLKQDQNAYNAYNVMDTVIMGNQRLYDIGKEKEALYAKEEMTEEDGIRPASWRRSMPSWAAGRPRATPAASSRAWAWAPSSTINDMATLDARLKVKVLLAQALFGNPDILLLDEPTNNLDINAVNWLEDFLLDFEGTVIVVSHDRHFLNTICTHIVDIDYNKIKMYVGNYDFWYDASQLMQNLMKNQNKKNEEKAQELQGVHLPLLRQQVQEQAGHRPAQAAGEDHPGGDPASSRRYPWVAFSPDREVGKDILFVTDVSKTIDGVKVLDKVSFIVGHGDKIAFVGDNENAQTALFQILTGELEPDEGTVKWGQTATFSYFPKDNTQVLQGLRRQSGGVAAPVVSPTPTRPICGVFGPDALLRRRGLQARQGALRRREGAVHALPDDALRGQRAAAGPAHQPPGSGVHRRPEQRPGGRQVQRALCLPRPPAGADRGQPGVRLHLRRQAHRPQDDLRRVPGEPEGRLIDRNSKNRRGLAFRPRRFFYPSGAQAVSAGRGFLR